MGEALKQFEKNLKEIQTKLLTNPDIWDKVGKFAVNLIQKRTRLGYGVSAPGEVKQALKPLSPGYVKWRKKHRPPGPTTPQKSNLTYTGDMLEDIGYRIINGHDIEIFMTTDESNKKAAWNQQNGRPFLYISDTEYTQIKNYIEQLLNEEIKKL